MTDKIFSLTTPLYQAVSTLESSLPPAITSGNPISGSTATTLAYGSQLISDNNYNSGLSDGGAIGFVPLISAPGNYSVSLMINSSSPNKYVRLLLDGQTAGGGPINVPVSNSAASVNVGTFNFTAGQHGLIVEGQYASNNNYSGNSCSFTSLVMTPVSVVQITAQPQNQVAVAGDQATFSVTATGPGLTYQWFFNGNALAGQTGSTLTLSNLTPSQSGNYTVTVTSSVGVVVSNPVALVVTGASASATDTPALPPWALAILALALLAFATKWGIKPPATS